MLASRLLKSYLQLSDFLGRKVGLFITGETIEHLVPLGKELPLLDDIFGLPHNFVVLFLRRRDDCVVGGQQFVRLYSTAVVIRH